MTEPRRAYEGSFTLTVSIESTSLSSAFSSKYHGLKLRRRAILRRYKFLIFEAAPLVGGYLLEKTQPTDAVSVETASQNSA